MGQHWPIIHSLLKDNLAKYSHQVIIDNELTTNKKHLIKVDLTVAFLE